jgi:hypothetical protein
MGMLSLPETAPVPTVLATEAGADMRDEFGLQPGANLGIIETLQSDGPNNMGVDNQKHAQSIGGNNPDDGLSHVNQDANQSVSLHDRNKDKPS